MNLAKAIELNIDSERSLRDHKHPDHADAIKLGIEALKLVAQTRGHSISPVPRQLPGETED